MLDRITQKIVSATDLSKQSACIAQRYVSINEFAYKRDFIVDSGTILFSNGSNRLVTNSLDSVNCLDINISSTVCQSIENIALEVGLWLSNDRHTLPNPLVPEKIFEDTAKLNELEELLFKTIMTGHLHQIAHQPRMDIRYDEELVDISRAKKISNKAHRYLAVHSETWQRRTLAGVYPKKLLAKISDDDYLIYENKVFARLLDRLKLFLQQRYRELTEQIKNIDEALDLGKADENYHKLTAMLCTLWSQNLSDEVSEEALKQLTAISNSNIELQEAITKLQGFGLYPKISQANKNIANQLHKTNILMHDQHYRHVGVLWTKLNHQSNQSESLIKKLEANCSFQKNYNQYVLLIILRSFSELGFNISKESSQKLFLKRNEIDWTIIITFDELSCCWELSHHFNQLPLRIVAIANILDEETVSAVQLNNNIIVLTISEELPVNYIKDKNIIVASPLNFMATEYLIIQLIKWLYTPLLLNYASGLSLNKLSGSAIHTLEQIECIEHVKGSYRLVDTLSVNSIYQINKNFCPEDNANILANHQQIQIIKRCPICSSISDFSPRSTNQTFIAKCLNNECGVEYNLTSDSIDSRQFMLYPKSEYKIAGRWNIEFDI